MSYEEQMEDPRRILQAAAETHGACDLHPRGGAWLKGKVVRVERGGVVVTAPGLRSGVDVACWLSVDGISYTFEASVLRTGVPVPDRSQDGVLLGFLDGWRRAEGKGQGLILEVLPSSGGSLSLIDGQARVVELSPHEWLVTTPSDFPLVFVQQGSVRLRLGLPDRAPTELSARVKAMSRGEGHLLYALEIQRVEDPPAYRELLQELRQVLGL
jgi:hypothetical protein